MAFHVDMKSYDQHRAIKYRQQEQSDDRNLMTCRGRTGFDALQALFTADCNSRVD